MKLNITIYLLLFIISGFTVQAQVQLDRNKCREMALEYSRQIKQSENQKEQARLSKKIARAGYFPGISASGQYFYKPDDLEYSIDGGPLPTYIPDEQGELQPNIKENPVTGEPITGPDGNPVFNMYAMMPDVNLNLGLDGVTLAGLRIEQPVYLGGKIRYTNKMAQTGIEMANIKIELKKSEVIVMTDEAFFKYVSVKAKNKAARDYKILLDSLVSTINESLEEGMATRNDLLKAQVKLNEAILMVQKSENGKQLARMNLCRIIGLPLETDIQVTENIPSEKIAKSNIDESDDDPEQRPEYQLLNKNIEMGLYEESIARSGMLPQVGVSGGYNYFGGLEINGQGTEDWSFTAIASVKIPVFNWFSERNKLSRARLETEAAQLNLEETEKQLQLEIAQARFNMKDAITRLSLTKTAFEQAAENLETSRERYEQGMERLVDFLEAQAQWQEARSKHIDAQTSVEIKHVQYLKATGQLIDRSLKKAEHP